MKLLLLILLAGCSTAGPFVTNVSSDGQGNLIIEQNMVRFQPGGIFTAGTPTTKTIRILTP
jgi:outer membrane protein assembly factor BamE (lipoprotein component of BamABCDE complex)